jgi:leucyl-tRNA synthetase
VLANDEVSEGYSVRGGHPVSQRMMMQWSLRISAFAERLLSGLENLDWSDSLKETQKNWIGKSNGAFVKFNVINSSNKSIEVFTTRPDTIFGVSFLVVAPEHSIIKEITIPSQKKEIESYQKTSKKRSERERQTNVKNISGAFTGSYAKHPVTGEKIPIWTSDYVLLGYGSGAIMAVPGHDGRDWKFAKHFELPIIQVVDGGDVQKLAVEGKEGKIINSNFLNGFEVKDAISEALENMKKNNWGRPHVQYRLRDAVFGRQRYWGEPIPIVYRDGVPETIDLSELPLKLPEVDSFLPTKDGDPPLARAKDWNLSKNLIRETTTMPGWAASSWYFLRFMDPKNSTTFADQKKINYWNQVDVYVGGSEHSTGHLLYSRFWSNFLFDLELIPFSEPFKKMVNQGMIQGVSAFVHRLNNSQTYVSSNSIKGRLTQRIPVDIKLINERNELNISGFKNWLPEYRDSEFELNDGILTVEREVEKMSKSKHNVISPDSICDDYGADALRLYEMFLGPITQSKPWDTKGINGITGFLRKSYRLLEKDRSDIESLGEKKIVHKLIDKVTRDMDSLSFNTSISAMMIAVNDLTGLKEIHINSLKAFTIILSPFAPHLAEEMWELLGVETSISREPFPICNNEYLQEDSIKYPVQFNGKTRFFIEVRFDMKAKEIEQEVLNHEKTQNYIQGKSIKKIIIVPKRIVNLVII